MKKQCHTYKAYSIACAIVWAAIILTMVALNREPLLHTIALVCGGWWLGWLSATIARSVYPPPVQKVQGT